MGDDWPDLPLLRMPAWPVRRPTRMPRCKAVAHHVTAARGGHGAAREFCDLLLMAAGRYAALLQDHRATLDAR
jgi:3-deoxy-D-manno-octulosonate 8-phosphate phosphatase (KDO 8-P phosphatase)